MTILLKGKPVADAIRQAAAEGGYGAALGSANILEVGAGERMIETAADLIRGLGAGPAPPRRAGFIPAIDRG